MRLATATTVTPGSRNDIQCSSNAVASVRRGLEGLTVSRRLAVAERAGKPAVIAVGPEVVTLGHAVLDRIALVRPAEAHRPSPPQVFTC